ncbi:MAG: potassium transporter TrkG [Pseudomonadota bacterium]
MTSIANPFGAFFDRSLSQMTDLRGSIIVILLWWIIGPAFASIPFMLQGAPTINAYFEAVSALTTTGGWLSPEAVWQNASGMIWRAVLQWMGGLASISIAAAIFIRPAFIGIDTLLPPFSRGDRDSYLHAIREAVGAFVGVYLLLTLICFICLMIADAPVLDGLVMALSMIASGGMIPNEKSVLGYAFPVVGVLLPFMVLGGANFILLTRSVLGVSSRNRDTETGIYLAAIFIVGVIFWIAAGAGDLDLIPAQIFNAASLFSTNGVLIGDGPTLPLALVTVIIGGSAVSAAGGFKILRWLVIIRRAREEIRLLVVPRGVFRKPTVANELGVWVHFLVFTLILASMTLIIALAGHEFELSVTTAISVLANAGPVIAVADGGSDFSVFSGPLKLILCLGMILGRLEAVVALAIFNAAFWRS